MFAVFAILRLHDPARYSRTTALILSEDSHPLVALGKLDESRRIEVPVEGSGSILQRGGGAE